MNLTLEQKNAVRQGEAVRLTDPDLDVECIVVRADVFDRARALIVNAGDDPREFYPLIAQTMADDDANDPLLDTYQHYQRKT
jgi:hypothetical protein